MASTNENVEVGNFIWTDECVKILCELCIQFIMKNGHGQAFKWRELQKDFETVTKRKIHFKSLKNKYDAMKREWNIWKFLKRGETGLGWDPVSGKLSYSDEWWERKIKEKPDAKKFRNKSVHPSIEELWDHLFRDAVATGTGCVVPPIDPSKFNEAQHMNLEDGDVGNGEEDNIDQEESDVYSQYTQYSSSLQNLENQEHSFWRDFANEVTNGGIPTPNQVDNHTQIPSQGKTRDAGGSKQPQKTTTMTTKPVQMKRKRRQSAGVAMLKEHIMSMQSKCDRALEIMESDTTSNVNTQVGSSIATAMNIINRMVVDYDLLKGSDLWCFAICLVEDAVKREIFLNMDDDASRMAWIKFLHAKEKYIMDIEKRKRKKRCQFWIMASCTTSALAAYYYRYMYKEPCMTSLQTGEDWMREVLNGLPIRCVNAFRMSSPVFMQLCEELQTKYGLNPSDKMSVVEKVGIFVYTIALGISNRDVSERFQRSGETISRSFHEVLEAISGRSKDYMGLARDIIRPKDPTFQFIPSHISNDERYMPYFKDCIGCIDGTHIDACIPETEQLRYRGRKGVPTFNVMAVCDFDMCFTFISAGWEGSTHDTRVFLYATKTPAMNFPKPPEGRYYLVDKGYPDRKGYLVPYPKTRYHLSQFKHEPATNAQEAFNRAHSSLRSCIERSFGVLKKRWKILTRMPKYSVETQIDVIIAAFALHNFIRNNSEEDLMFTMLERNPNYIPHDELQDFHATDTYNENLRETCNEMKEIRNNIATLIWNARR